MTLFLRILYVLDFNISINVYVELTNNIAYR